MAGLSAQTLSAVYVFDGTHGGGPESSPIQGSDGYLYGTTFAGGSHRFGTVYKMDLSGHLTTLYNFCSQTNCADGSFPLGSLVEGNDGNFYGTTSQGGAHNVGTVFVISGAGSFNVLHSFAVDGQGFNPFAGLVKGSDGNFYGTTESGGNGGGQQGGTVFKITSAGVLTTLYKFCSVGACSDGKFPAAPLVQANDGNFYGTTTAGGNDSCTLACGTVFKITPNGTLTTIHLFSQSDGAEPQAGLVQASDGNLYGTTWTGGSASGCGRQSGTGCGTIFKITLGGTFTSLYSLCQQSNCTDGLNPYYGSLLQASNGSLYGTTWQGGSDNSCPNGCGVLYRWDLAGHFTTVHSFIRLTDGASPFSGVIQANDSGLYGTTNYGGGGNGTGQGTIYRYTIPIPPVPSQFVTLPPCRVVDTRNPNGTFGGPPIQGQTSRSFPLPQGSCGIPSTATVYSLNVTVVPRGRLGYLTIWPTGQAQPQVSTMNSDGRIKANAAIVPAGSSGAVSVYVSDTTDVILDINGYFVSPQAQTYQFYPLPPCRLVDTRGNNGHLGGPYLTGAVERDFPLLESPCINQLPLQPAAYSLNVTALPHPAGQFLGYLTVWPAGGMQPGVSTLNNPNATNVANAAILPAGTGGAIAVYPSQSTDLLIDINGYFATQGTGGMSLYAMSPCRVLDTRDNHGQPFNHEKTIDVVGSACAPSLNSQAYVFNATVVPSGALGFLTLWPNGQDQPNVSTLNAQDGAVTSNMAIVPTDDGSIDAYASALTHLIMDISGYFAP
jgi:uncharacterized repeat protein (TIGR03803 family)